MIVYPQSDEMLNLRGRPIQELAAQITGDSFLIMRGYAENPFKLK
jgi:hypothetical protein